MVRELDSETRWNASDRDAGVIVVGLARDIPNTACVATVSRVQQQSCDCLLRHSLMFVVPPVFVTCV